MDAPVIEVADLKVHFPVGGGWFAAGRAGVVKAVDGVSFAIRRGETLGLVGESGCGKSTVGRAIVGLAEPTAGSVRFLGDDLAKLEGERRRAARRHIQLIFQDPYASLNPRMTVAQILAEPILIHRLRDGREALRARIDELLGLVGMSRHFGERYPHELSGGQRQRVGIARALACEPDLIVCDEPVSALDVSIQAQVINLLQELQQRLGLTYLFIAHGLGVIRHISDRVAVMYLGRIAELGDKATIYHRPAHPYTRALMSASPVPDPRVEKSRRRIILTGDVPNPIAPPPGCRFSSRCPIAIARCRAEEPPLAPQPGAGHLAACWRATEVDAAMAEAAAPTRAAAAGR